jgi:hypothetical protein
LDTAVRADTTQELGLGVGGGLPVSIAKEERSLLLRGLVFLKWF